MKKILTVILLLTSFIIINQNKAQAMGLFYTNSTYPITATGSKTEDLTTLKKGSSSATNIFYLVEFGNASIDKAIKEAGIKKISHIDVNDKSIFIFWRKVTVNVYGE